MTYVVPISLSDARRVHLIAERSNVYQRALRPNASEWEQASPGFSSPGSAVVIGFLGELAASRLFGVPMPEETGKPGDYDLFVPGVGKIEVKTARSEYPYLLVRSTAVRVDRVYVKMQWSGNAIEPVFRFVGWASAKEVMAAPVLPALDGRRHSNYTLLVSELHTELWSSVREHAAQYWVE